MDGIYKTPLTSVCETHNMAEQENQKAQEIKRMLVSNYAFIEPDDVRITHDIDSYHIGTNRQASDGKVSCFVLVSAPEIPEIKSDDFYQKNPHRKKPSKSAVDNAKKNVKLIKNACKTVADMFDDAEFVPVSGHQGYTSSHGNEQYMNIRIR